MKSAGVKDTILFWAGLSFFLGAFLSLVGGILIFGNFIVKLFAGIKILKPFWYILIAGIALLLAGAAVGTLTYYTNRSRLTAEEKEAIQTDA